MKLIILLFPWLCAFAKTTVGQKNIQFIYIGSEEGDHDSVLITSAHFESGYSESRNLKVYYTDQTTLDTLRAYLAHSIYVRKSHTITHKAGEIDTLELLDAYEITGADAQPLYIDGKSCFNLFLSAIRYLNNVGLSATSGWYAMNDLIFQCHEEFLHRDTIEKSVRQINIYKIVDTPRIAAKSSN